MERMGKEGKMLSQQINEKEWILPPLNGLRHNLRLKCYFLIFLSVLKIVYLELIERDTEVRNLC